MAKANGPELKQRMAAIAFADVANYSRHMADDAVGTVNRWAALRDGILLPELDDNSGRLVSSAGDAVLAEFSSASEAVEWALAVQKALRTRAPADRDMQLRIGINIDDVLDDGETLQSDGVIIAARIHQHAAPGDIVVTRVVRDLVRGRLKIGFRDLGTPALKNIDRPVQVFAVEERETDSQVVRPHASWSSRPTLAVLPFRDSGANEEDRYFGEGITEEIIGRVSRSRSMFVVARNSTLQFQNGGRSPQEIAAALGVKYLLTGSNRRQGNRLRINTELMDVDRNRAVWADHFDGTTEDLFDFQDTIVSSIVAALEPNVLRAEAANLGSRPTESLDAYDCVLRALSMLYQFEHDSYSGALDLLERAVKLDDAYAQAHGYLAWGLNFWIVEGWSTDVANDRARAIFHARRAVELDPGDALTLSVRGHILSILEGRPFEALEILEDALHLNENLPVAWALSATAHAYLGEADEARDRLLNVWRLTPYDPLNFFFWTAGGLVEFVARDYDEAIRLLRKAQRSKSRFMACMRLLAACLALHGDKEEAREIAGWILEKDPGFSIAGFMAWYPLKDPESRERLIMGLSAAGLPN